MDDPQLPRRFIDPIVFTGRGRTPDEAAQGAVKSIAERFRDNPPPPDAALSWHASSYFEPATKPTDARHVHMITVLIDQPARVPAQDFMPRLRFNFPAGYDAWTPSAQAQWRVEQNEIAAAYAEAAARSAIHEAERFRPRAPSDPGLMAYLASLRWGTGPMPDDHKTGVPWPPPADDQEYTKVSPDQLMEIMRGADPDEVIGGNRLIDQLDRAMGNLQSAIKHSEETAAQLDQQGADLAAGWLGDGGPSPAEIMDMRAKGYNLGQTWRQVIASMGEFKAAFLAGLAGETDPDNQSRMIMHDYATGAAMVSAKGNGQSWAELAGELDTIKAEARARIDMARIEVQIDKSPAQRAYDVAACFFAPSDPKYLVMRDLVEIAIERSIALAVDGAAELPAFHFSVIDRHRAAVAELIKTLNDMSARYGDVLVSWGVDRADGRGSEGYTDGAQGKGNQTATLDSLIDWEMPRRESAGEESDPPTPFDSSQAAAASRHEAVDPDDYDPDGPDEDQDDGSYPAGEDPGFNPFDPRDYRDR